MLSVVNVTTTRRPAVSRGIVNVRPYHAASLKSGFTPWSSNQSERTTSWPVAPPAPSMPGILPQPQLSSAPGTASGTSFVRTGRSCQRPFSDQRARVGVVARQASSSEPGSGGAPAGSGALQGRATRLRLTASVSGPTSTVPDVPKLCGPIRSVAAPSGIGKSRTQSVQLHVPSKPKTFGHGPTRFPVLSWKLIGMRPFIQPSRPRTRSVVFMRVRSVRTPHSGWSATV